MQKTNKELLKELGDRARKYRFDNGQMNLDTLAEAAGCSTVTLSQLENGKLENTTLDKIVGVANAIGLEVSLTLTKKQ